MLFRSISSRGGRWVAGVLNSLPPESRRSTYLTRWHSLGIGPKNRVNGYFKDVVLLEQASVQDSKKTVKTVLDEAGTAVSRFARFEVGA